MGHVSGALSAVRAYVPSAIVGTHSKPAVHWSDATLPPPPPAPVADVVTVVSVPPDEADDALAALAPPAPEALR